MKTLIKRTEKESWRPTQVSRFLKAKSESYAETLLWNSLRRRFPVKFERFFPIASIVADFYCEKAKLIIELESKAQILPKEVQCSKERCKELEDDGIKVLRFSNYEIFHDLKKVLSHIEKEIEDRSKSSLLVPLKMYYS